MTPQELLDFEFYSSDLDESLTVRQYLVKLLSTLWRDGESFSSKRPFGNSSWQFEIEDALASDGRVATVTDEYGDLVAEQSADPLILAAIEML
jgi:hypothetical protein